MERVYYENYGLGIKNYKGYETNEIFDVDIKLDDEFWNKYFREYSINVEARKFANEVTKKLSNHGKIRRTKSERRMLYSQCKCYTNRAPYPK